MEYHSAEEGCQAHVAYCLVPVPVRSEQGGGLPYVPEPFAADGFVDCTGGRSPLLLFGDTFYSKGIRHYSVMVTETRRIAPELRYDDHERTCPHIHGELNTDAVLRRLSWNVSEMVPSRPSEPSRVMFETKPASGNPRV
jgi:uncharacterized protein (DUF952 family)